MVANAVEAENKSSTVIVTDDARPLIIRKYLEKYKSPLVPYSDLIFELSQTYGYDYRWIVAIAQQESNLCKKIPENSHNCWGYGIHKNGTLRFESYELALKVMLRYLKRVYFDKGLDTPELIMKKYCPSSNGSWLMEWDSLWMIWMLVIFIGKYCNSKKNWCVTDWYIDASIIFWYIYPIPGCSSKGTPPGFFWWHKRAMYWVV